ncbi:hypothetical protein MKW94_008130 [Papaver nudicaule]|uniref:F-box domain-containing protein n=1 Tax=Papaver nudicaule TaxID=74823 RepID=A0AA41UYB8_PAPNU|nr:hypothetical protein [Papaver nudicaule]
MELTSPPIKRQKVLHDAENVNGNDCIGFLPESVVLNILSYLPTKFVVQTSVVSKDWRYLWTFIPRLDFDDELFRIHRKKNKKQIENPKFVDFVSKVMKVQDQARYVERFRLRWSHFDMSLVNNWINVSVGKNLKELDLDLRNNASVVKLPYAIGLPLCMFNSDSLVALKLKLFNCELIVLPTSICLNKLKKLHLEGVRFSGDGAIQRLLSGCPILETLEMVGCQIYDQKVVEITLPSLRNLCVRHIYLPRNSVIKISNLDLLFFKYTVMECNMKNNFIYSLSSLINAYFEVHLQPCGSYSRKRYNECFTNVRRLLSGLSSVRSLTLPESTLQMLSLDQNLLESLPCFYNLRKLMLTSLRKRDYFQVIAYLLQSSPSLESLVIALEEQPRIGAVIMEDGQEVPTELLCLEGLVLNHLKEVTISRLWGIEVELEFLKLILRKASALQKLIINEMNDSKKRTEICWKMAMFEKASASCTISLL